MADMSGIQGLLWSGSTDEGNYEHESASATIRTELSDRDEVVVHALLHGDETAECSIYVSALGALALSEQLRVLAVEAAQGFPVEIK